MVVIGEQILKNFKYIENMENGRGVGDSLAASHIIENQQHYYSENHLFGPLGSLSILLLVA